MAAAKPTMPTSAQHQPYGRTDPNALPRLFVHIIVGTINRLFGAVVVIVGCVADAVFHVMQRLLGAGFELNVLLIGRIA